MNKRLTYSLFSIAISLIGLINSGYITLNRLMGTVPACTPPFQCEKVLDSAWLNLGPIPLPTIGVFFFAALFISSLVVFIQSESMYKLESEKYLWWLALIGAGFGLYTISAMTFAIRAYCLYCVISDFLLAINFGLNIWYHKSQSSTKAPRP